MLIFKDVLKGSTNGAEAALSVPPTPPPLTATILNFDFASLPPLPVTLLKVMRISLPHEPVHTHEPTCVYTHMHTHTQTHTHTHMHTNTHTHTHMHTHMHTNTHTHTQALTNSLSFASMHCLLNFLFSLFVIVAYFLFC